MNEYVGAAYINVHSIVRKTWYFISFYSANKGFFYILLAPIFVCYTSITKTTGKYISISYSFILSVSKKKSQKKKPKILLGFYNDNIDLESRTNGLALSY